MNEQEKTIASQIDTINDMLEVVIKELNELETIDSYDMELEEPEYKIIVTVTKSLKSENEIK